MPLYTLRSVDFVSKRVGNYIYNPEYGALARSALGALSGHAHSDAQPIVAGIR